MTGDFGHASTTEVKPSSTPTIVYPPSPKGPPGLQLLPSYPGQVDQVELEAGHKVERIRWIWQELNNEVMYVVGWIKVLKWNE